MAIMIKVDLQSVHFCKGDKVRYRKHLTIGIVAATALGMIATAYGVVWASHAANIVNAITAGIWIWE